jgi:hypothetical protein
LSSLSPDDSLRLTLLERRLDIDRNFQLTIEDVKSGRTRVIFRSPDEGRPVGSERVIWSADSSRFVLLGRHFYVKESANLSSGEQAYLLMDVPSGRIWCNAEQQSRYPGFEMKDLAATSWLGWTPE